MALYEWTGALDYVASNPGNWVVSGVVPSTAPTSTDDILIDIGQTIVTNICVFDLPEINSINHNLQDVTFAFGGGGITQHNIHGFFYHNGPVGLANVTGGGTTGEITVVFDNTLSGTGDIVYFPRANATWYSANTSNSLTPIRSNTIPKLRFLFGTQNPPCLPHGVYPKVELERDILPHYNENESEVTVFPEVDFYHLITNNGASVKEANSGIFQTDPIKELDKTFRVRRFTMAVKEAFEGGKGHWIWHAAGTQPNSELPLSGTGRQTFGSGVVNKLENITIVVDEVSGNNQQAIPPGNHYLKKLTVAEGVRLRVTRGVCELNIASRPNIRGSWQFYAIADGIYRSKKSSMIEPLETGGTNTRAYDANCIPFVNAALPHKAFLDMQSSLQFDASTETLQIGPGGVQFGDGTTQTTAATGGGGGGGIGVNVQDEGIATSATVGTTLNFVDGQHAVATVGTPQPLCVEATGAGAVKTITIDGSKVRTNATDTLPAYLDAKIEQGDNMSITLNTANAATSGNSFRFAADNDKVGISSADTTPDFLENKLVAGSNITLSKLNAGGNETIEISSTGGGGGGGGGYPLFRHDQLPTANNFNPFRLLQDGDTIELGVTAGGDDNADVSVFTPINNFDNPVIVDIIDIGSHATNTGREYMFFGQDAEGQITEYQTFNSGSPNTAIPIFFVESMRDVANGFVNATRLRIYPSTRNTRLNNVRVMDAGKHDVVLLGDFPIDPENPDGGQPQTVRILLIVDCQVLADRGRFQGVNYELRGF